MKVYIVLSDGSLCISFHIFKQFNNVNDIIIFSITLIHRNVLSVIFATISTILLFILIQLCLTKENKYIRCDLSKFCLCLVFKRRQNILNRIIVNKYCAWQMIVYFDN